MKRGDLVTIAAPGDYGKPRPALVIQSDLFDEHPSVTVLPLTGALRETPLFRVTVEADAGNGLHKRSQVMVDKAVTVSREKAGAPFGRLDEATMLTVTRALVVFLGLASPSSPIPIPPASARAKGSGPSDMPPAALAAGLSTARGV